MNGEIKAIPIYIYMLFLILGAMVFLPFNATGSDNYKSINSEIKNKKWTGDFDQVVQNRFIRVLVPYSKTFYFIDRAAQRGLIYETVKEFEKSVNKELKTRHLKIHVLFIPTSREKLLTDLAQGFGDITAGNLTITDKRSEIVDFCSPLLTGVNEILVAGKDTKPIKDIFDLSGEKIHVRKSSSYFESLENANKKLSAAGKAKIEIVEANDNLEDEDLLEMINAGLIPMTIIDSHKGEFWVQIFENITLYPKIRFRKNSQIAWAVQKGTPELKKVINRFVKANKKGTLMGNILFNRYLKNKTYLKNNLEDKERKKFLQTIEYFRKYGEIYNFDWLMLAALAYQESTIDQSKRSHAGAVGVMQILPTTAKDKKINIPDIEKIEPNIHAGTKYLHFIMERYFNDPGINRLNRMLLTFAAYNAGPAGVAKLRKEAKSMNLDPNIWFENVEVVAAKRIGRETVQYVSNIFKYYIAYTSIFNQRQAKNKQIRKYN